MADIKNIDVFQIVTSVSFEVEPNTNVININKVTIEGSGGNQDLQSVTDVGANTTNGINIDTEDTYEIGLYAISSAVGIKGESRETYGVQGYSNSATGVYGNSDNGYGVQGYSESGVAVYGNSQDQIGVQGNSYSGTAISAYSEYGTGLVATSESGVGVSAYSNSIGLEVNGNGTIAIEANLGNSNKGLVINSGASSTGNFIELDKNGVDKLIVNQAGELTATKLIKQGGTSNQFLMADGSISTGGGGATNLSPSQTATNFTINSDTGTDATVPLGDGTLAGATLNDYTTAEKNKLAAITGTNTGNQDLQQVTDIGATTTNGIYINGITNDYGLVVETNSNNYPSIYVDNVGGGVNANGIEVNSLEGIATSLYAQNGVGIRAEAVSGIPIVVYGNGSNTPSIDVNLGNTNKGVVIDSGTSSTGNPIEVNKNGVNKLTVNQQGELTAAKLIKDGGTSSQFLKANGSVDNNTYLTSADLPSTLDLYATTSPDPVIAGYTALVRSITDTRYDTTAVNVPTPTITGTLASPTFCGAVISDPSILLGNPGVFNFSVIGKIRRTGGSTSSGADFFFSIYKRDTSGVETLIADSAPVVVPANGGIYTEYISIALWNNGIFLSTDRVVLKFYGIKSGSGSGATYEFLFGGADPVRGTAAISSAIIPNLYLRDLADVEKIPALNNEVLYWNDADSLWEHSLAEDLVPNATATQKGLVSTTVQTFAGAKTFAGAITASNLSGTNTGDNATNTQYSGLATDIAGKISKNVATTYTTNTITTVTASEYAAIGTKDPNTLYFIV